MRTSPRAAARQGQEGRGDGQLASPGRHVTSTQDDIAARVARECAEQGIPSKLEDPAIISRILILMNAGRHSRAEDVATRSISRGLRQDRTHHRAS